MIVTRNRRKAFPWKRVLLPSIAIAVVAFAAWWAPSRNVITSGPLAPEWKTAGSAFDTVAAPFHFAAQNELLTERNREIVRLQQQVAQAQSAGADKDKQIGALKSQVAQAQSQAASAQAAANARPSQPAAPASSSSGTTGASTAGTAAGDMSANATADMRRTANYWASMEPENAAKVVQKLPVPYVARVFALMSADAAGSILDALPPAYAAAVTQENPQLRR